MTKSFPESNAEIIVLLSQVGFVVKTVDAHADEEIPQV